MPPPPRKHTPGKVPVARIAKAIVKAAVARPKPSGNNRNSIAKHPPRIRKIPAKVIKVVTVVVPPKAAAAVARPKNSNTRRSIAKHPPTRATRVAKAVAKAVKEEVKKGVELEEGIEAFRARTQRVKEAIKEEVKRETLPVEVVVPDLIDLDQGLRNTSSTMKDEEDFFFPPDPTGGVGIERSRVMRDGDDDIMNEVYRNLAATMPPGTDFHKDLTNHLAKNTPKIVKLNVKLEQLADLAADDIAKHKIRSMSEFPTDAMYLKYLDARIAVSRIGSHSRTASMELNPDVQYERLA